MFESRVHGNRETARLTGTTVQGTDDQSGNQSGNIVGTLADKVIAKVYALRSAPLRSDWAKTVVATPNVVGRPKLAFEIARAIFLHHAKAFDIEFSETPATSKRLFNFVMDRLGSDRSDEMEQQCLHILVQGWPDSSSAAIYTVDKTSLRSIQFTPTGLKLPDIPLEVPVGSIRGVSMPEIDNFRGRTRL